ncbi:hypothetical protein NC653_040975 [Populus alba x Populus x berolinensis]|uniref:VDE lipocalin domain-containing protein n=1 Tax=Populus alba x Populus x berolinensis TaxID=444605 RepID=A0AAD6PNE4_9ROSI|nr:hypothetical protein NC653_040975 [Populus alba x Populus x berolinensis]
MTMSSFTIKMAESSALELEMAAKSIGRDFNKFIEEVEEIEEKSFVIAWLELAKCIANPSCAANVKCRTYLKNSTSVRSHERSVYLNPTSLSGTCPGGYELQILAFSPDQLYRGLCKIQCILQCSTIMTMSSFTIKMTEGGQCIFVIARLELAKCSANPSCAANVACLHTCNKGPDEIECQIKCGDLFENSLVMSVQSHEKSVYLRSLMFGDSVPNPAFLVKNFKVADFIGKWFVTSGLFTRSTVQRNDAWDVVYTRSAVLPESIVLELEMATRRDFNKFISTDNKGS